VVGYVLTNTADWRKAAEWLADWPERPGVEPWMLINLVIALRSLGRDAEANRVSRHAVTLPEGPTSRHHTLWLGLDAALAGETAAAVEHLGRVDPAACDAAHRYLHALVRALVTVQQATGADRARVFADVRKDLAAAAKACSSLGADRQAIWRTYNRCVGRLARDAGGWQARVWDMWRRLWPLVPERWVRFR
jgi:hypothetical protein